ncbi:MAG TPA: winged helix-turn-helix domain-containing protein, partial [Nevskiaceae bacterium]|nr:winged helix-turn-helix domain-containing protein [Nevskiaceae bacterium]
MRIDGEVAEVEPRPMDLLLLLLRHAGDTVDHEEIVRVVWAGRFNDSASANVSNAVGKLRRLFKDEQREIIKNVPKKGYRFAARVERLTRAAPAVAPSIELERTVPGRPHWRLTEHLDAGGYGDVWVATNTKTREERVFKFCNDEVRLSALKRESTLFRMLKETLGDRAPVPTLLEWQFETSPYYLESERWGCDLKAWADRHGGLSALPVETRLHLMILTAEVVAAVHAVGVLHKDLKPQNILVRGDRENPEVRLCDFGAGTMLEWSTLEDLNITRMGFTHTVAHAGTPTYLAPELQAGGTPSIQSDVYSLGVLLYQLAVGDFRAVAFGWEHDITDLLLRGDIASCIDRDPAVRPPSASIVAQKLRTLGERRRLQAEEREAEQRNRALAESLERTRARRPWVIAAVSALFVAVAASSFLTYKARRAAEQAAENERVARAVADFLVNDIVRQSSPDYGGRVDVTLKAAMLGSAHKISERLKGPVAAELNQSLAEIVASLSARDDAARLAREAAREYARLYGPSDRRTLSAKLDEFSYRMLLETGSGLISEFEKEIPAGIAKLPLQDPLTVKAAMVRAWMAFHYDGDMPKALAILEKAFQD